MDENVILKQMIYLTERKRLQGELKEYEKVLKETQDKYDVIKNELYSLDKHCQHINLDGTNAVQGTYAYDICSICGEMW